MTQDQTPSRMGLRDALRALAGEAFARAAEDGSSLSTGHPAIAAYNPSRDVEVSSQPTFGPATELLQQLPEFLAAADATDSARVVTQFVYDFLRDQTSAEFHIGQFDAAWTSFEQELDRQDWDYLSICYLDNFTSAATEIDLGQDVSIYHRSSYQFLEEGWSEFEIDKLHEDWHGWATYVLVAHHAVRKAPDNLVLTTTSDPAEKIDRAVLALRLAQEGDVAIGGAPMVGRILSTRKARNGFQLSGGATVYGRASRAHGDPYHLSNESIPVVRDLYSRLETAKLGAGKSPYNLGLALRWFSSSYDRSPTEADSRLVDLATSLEAVLGTDIEIAFRLSFRSASLLASSTPESQASVYTSIKSYYDTRSRIVHGGTLNAKHEASLASYPEFRQLIRRLLVGLLRLAGTRGHPYGDKVLRANLDQYLQDPVQRHALREVMGLLPSDSTALAAGPKDAQIAERQSREVRGVIDQES